MPKKQYNFDNSKIPRLFELMEKANINATDLAAETGISQGNIGDWKSGRSAPTIEKLIILADYFDVSIDFLVGRSNKVFTITEKPPAPALSPEDQELLKMFHTLPDFQKGIIFGEVKVYYQQAAEKSYQQEEA